VTTTLLLDNSAWVRLGDTGLPDERADELADDLESGRIATCLPFLSKPATRHAPLASTTSS
jgi:predicted nucleic acid-binding protein